MTTYFIEKVLNDLPKITDIKSFIDYATFIADEYHSHLPSEIRRENGIYYTHFSLARDIVKKVIEENSLTTEQLPSCFFLEPCVGTGNFVFAYLEYLHSLNLSRDKIINAIEKIYVVDNDLDVLEIYKLLFVKFIKILLDVTLPNDFFVGKIGHGLLFDLKKETPEYISISEVFPNLNGRKFDIVITNPPYKNLKAENKGELNLRHAKNKATYALVKELATTHTPLSNYGVLNIYKLFVEEIVKNYTSFNAAVGLLIPSSFLTDKSCSILRKYSLINHELRLVDILPENNPYLDAQQSLCVVVLKAFSKTKKVKICYDFNLTECKYLTIGIESILNDITDNAIFALSEHEYRIFNQLILYPKVKELPYIKNLRGELDLTTNKNVLQAEKTQHPLVRGRDINYFTYYANNVTDYVSPSFVSSCSKREYIYRPRIACQQIANLRKERRISFTSIPSGCVLGNSCNFVCVEDNDQDISLNFLLGVLNSNIINWFFKLLSTNNHVNNYEIDIFPIPINSPYKTRIAELAESLMYNKNEELLAELNRLVNASYKIEAIETKMESTSDIITARYFSDISNLVKGITIDDAKGLLLRNEICEFIVSKYIGLPDDFLIKTLKSLTSKYNKLLNGVILNHTTFKLSDLDMEMIVSVPQGGNWKDIPQKTVAKSRRLIRISETGGRTTLYGRIDYSKPSYTITTYFNRPGNGTYIHPIHNRVITVREAARLQSFPDNFYFTGNKTQLLQQVGNAVPPLLAYSIGQNIKRLLNIDKCVDLFCGAGGLSLGMEFAGIKSVLASDFDLAACNTFKTNMPWSEVFCDDITKDSTKIYIAKLARKHKIDFLCGGPPCQGFSLAGKRFIDDSRNVLFKHYIDVAKRIMPKVIMFENVEGLLSFQKGSIYKEILDVFQSIGYNAEGRTLIASDYGVPQRRKRVIVLCVRKDIKVLPSELFPTPISQAAPTAYDAIADLENISVNENIPTTNNLLSKYVSDLNALAKKLYNHIPNINRS